MATAVVTVSRGPETRLDGAPVPGRAGRLLGLVLGDATRPRAAAIRAFALIALVHLATERGGTALTYAGLPTVSIGWRLFAVSIWAVQLSTKCSREARHTSHQLPPVNACRRR